MNIFFVNKSEIIQHLQYDIHLLQKKAKGSVLLEQVFQNLELVEKDYFGLQFTENGLPPNATNTELTVSYLY